MRKLKSTNLDLFANPIEENALRQRSAYSSPDFIFDLEDTGEVVENEKTPERHFPGLTIFVIIVLGVLAFQCYRLQIQQGRTNQSLAEGNSLRYVTTNADRGLIEDWSKEVIAQNTRDLALAVDMQSLPSKKADRLAVYDLLKKKAGIDQKTIDLIENNRLNNPGVYAVKNKLSKDESLLYKEEFFKTPGVLLYETPIRKYTDFPSSGQLLGYVGSVSAEDVKNGHSPDERIGKIGLEKVYDQDLIGTPGKQKVEVDAYGDIVRTLSVEQQDLAKTGQTLRLSLDLKLQNIVATALKNELERRTKLYGEMKDLGASAVVLDPSTGAIKAMVSLPDYNAELFASGITQKDYDNLLQNPANPLLNRAIQGQYPSGSIIKPLIASAGLQAGVIGPNTEMVTPAAITIGQYSFPDWKVHGLTNTRKAIAESNDIFFYAVGGGWADKGIKGLGIDQLNKYLGEFGLGKSTEVDLTGEVDGLVPGADWKQKNIGEPWYIGDTYHSSIGQGYTLVTPLQMAMSTAAIVNGGTLYKPQLAWSFIDPNSGAEAPLPHTILNKDFISPTNLQVVREGMRQTVESGSARPLNTLKVTSAGKTGTAEFGNTGQTHAWYTGFAPYENPTIVFAIMIEGGGDSYYNSVPVAEEILRNYFGDPLAPGQKLNSEPELSNPEFKGEH